MYISQPPCGDASVEIKNKEILGMTGAKPLKDFHSSYTGNTERGILRSKPGRSDTPFHKKSNSLSCSDKIMKWCLTGFQGKLLNLFIEPLYLDSIILENPDIADNRLREAIDIV